MRRSMGGKGIVIAAPSSGSGKTVLTLSLLRLLRNARLAVRGCKAGPDYIDPAFHAIACGRTAFNLDPWAMTSPKLMRLAQAGAGGGLLIEGMMGLFDGAADGTGSAADLAAMLRLPVVLVVDCEKQSHSIGALVRGFRDHRSDVELAGVILNKVGSARHETMLRSSLESLAVRIFGAIRRDPRLSLPDRHLGLVQAGEITDLNAFIEDAASAVSENIDLEAFCAAFRPLPQPAEKADALSAFPLKGQVISIARDEAFSFIYPHIIMEWLSKGAQIENFSPLKDEAPSKAADAIYLPGGYPELHCERLANASNFRKGILSAADRDVKIYGECGGYMVLGERMIDDLGSEWPMLGLLKVTTSFEKRKLHLGYRTLTGGTGDISGRVFLAHEFHYTTVLEETGEKLFSATDALGKDLGTQGLSRGNVFGSFMHVIDGTDS